MKTYKLALAAAALLLMLAVSPALADDPQPGTLAKSAYTGVTAGGGGKAGKTGGKHDKVGVTSQSPAGLGAAEAATALTFYGWTNLMRLGSVGINSNSWGCVAAGEVCSQGWSSTNQNIYFLRSANYLCQNGSCTSYTYYGAYWWHWVWAGWRWQSSNWTWWSTTTQHYFNYSTGTFVKYTSNSQIF